MPAENSSIKLRHAACARDEEKLAFLEEMTANADAVQAKVLTEILTQNADMEYLQRYKLGGAIDRAAFKAKIPMVTYEDLRLDIREIAGGDRSHVLCAGPITEFLTRYIPGLDKGMTLYFMSIKADRETPGGLLARPVSTSHYKSHHFRTSYFTSTCTSPLATVLCPDNFQSTYAQFLCGLVHRLRVLRLGSTFASGLLRAIRFLQLHWEQLTQDIATGTLSSQITDVDIRNAVAEVLKPDPALAELIRVECSSGGLPMVCTAYGSSECFCSLNLHPMVPMSKPDEVSYTIMPFMTYFEFLPLNSNMAGESTMNAPLQLVDLVDVEVGKEYEIEQDRQGGASASSGASVQAVEALRGKRARVYQPGLYAVHPEALRHLLGALRGRRGRKAVAGEGDDGSVLLGDGGGNERFLPTAPGARRVYRAARDPTGERWHVCGDDGGCHHPWCLGKPFIVEVKPQVRDEDDAVAGERRRQ
ncbi:hypothetical protein Cni_G19232 [Canna indica]|uniref:GH3 middle domain-containing protein n=1 Tax=Canna indica TaxID=4628 RepID=A0AAQ3KM42_9LILI|nr:hypothetical protein Cni_G19232 [Canna indica]